MTLSAGQQSELEKPVTRFVYFAAFSFLSATTRVCSLNQTVTWGGYDWLGMGSVGGISAIEESQGTAAPSLSFRLNLAQVAWLTIAVDDVSEYRGRDAVLYFAPLTESFQLTMTDELVDTPVVCWRGTMDTMVSGITGSRGEATGQITLKCETSAHGLKRRPTLRMNAAQQKQRMAAQGLSEDKGFDYLNDLIGSPAKWLSIKFQSR